MLRLIMSDVSENLIEIEGLMYSRGHRVIFEDLNLTIKRGEVTAIEAEGRFLYGPPAADLSLEGEIIVQLSKFGASGFEGYQFGQFDELVTPVRAQLAELPRTDGTGHATVKASLPKVPKTQKPLEARVSCRARH